MTLTKMTLAAALLGATTLGAQAADLRIALQSDADVLDPDQSRTCLLYTSPSPRD